MSLNRSISVGLLLLLSACTLPGQRIPRSMYQPADGGEEEQSDSYELMRLTPRVLAGFVTPTPTGPVENEALDAAIRSYQYRIGPQDVLTFTVWDHPELTIPAGEFRSAESQGHLVDAAGRIFFPYIGDVEVAGRTLGEIRAEVSGGIARVIQNPQVDVRVVAFRSQKIQVSGQVHKPGVQAITDAPLTLIEALTVAGGGTPEAALQSVQVVRDGTALTFDVLALVERGDMRQNALLRGGDIVYVPENSYYSVHVLGEVREPGVVRMSNGRLNLTEAIVRSGGFDEAEADPGRIFVFRGPPEEPDVFWLDAQSPQAMLLATQFEMQPQDVVFVGSTGAARWNRLVALILPTIQSLWQTQSFLERLQGE